MPLIAPRLDTRKFQDIFEEARLRIPRYSPEWTDFNESDPGITLLQLFSWLTEMMLYQMNRVPDRSYIKFLQLMGLELRAAQPAVAHVTFNPQPGAEIAPVLQRTQLAGQPSGGGEPLIFETEAGLDLVRVPLADIQVSDGASFTVVTVANNTPDAAYAPLGFTPQPGSAIYFGFDPGDPPAAGRVFPDLVRLRVFLPPAANAGEPQAAADIRQAPVSPVELVWEYQAKALTPPRWTRLAVFLDETAGFTREGYILIEGPREVAATKEGKITETPRFWLRARLASGTYPAGTVPEVDLIRFNVVPAVNLSTTGNEVIDVSEGVPDQIFTLLRRPVERSSLVLAIEPPNLQAEPWQQVEDFFASGPDDPHYVLNPIKGEIRFGDGLHGRIPVAGSTIIAQQYRYGGGGAGNLPAGAINSPVSTLPGVSEVINERPAVGGRDEEDIEDFKQQAPRLLRSRNRAVTEEDFRWLASQAGGVWKATAVSLMHKDFVGVDVPGAITVVVVPDNRDRPPQPSSDLIAQVSRFIDNYRLLGTELFVKGPEYRKISVEALIAAQPYASFDAVKRDAIQAIDRYLDPRSWEFGADLHPTNLFSVIRNVEGVTSVVRLSLRVNGQPHDLLSDPVVLTPDALVYGEGHDITVQPATDR